MGSTPSSLRPAAGEVSFSYLFAWAHDGDQGLKSLSPMRAVKTLFLTQSMLPLLQLWGGRLRLDGFTSTLHTQNVQLGPSAAGGLLDYRPPRQNYPRGRLSVHLSGISLSFHFGRDAQCSEVPPLSGRQFLLGPSEVNGQIVRRRGAG
jgi:hypothetical protein